MRDFLACGRVSRRAVGGAGGCWDCLRWSERYGQFLDALGRVDGQCGEQVVLRLGQFGGLAECAGRAGERDGVEAAGSGGQPGMIAGGPEPDDRPRAAGRV
jgi:hypothetical protein